MLSAIAQSCDARHRDDIRAWLDISNAPPAAGVAARTPTPDGPGARIKTSITTAKGEYRLTLHNVRVCPDRIAHADDPAHETWGVEVELQALGVDDVPVNPFYARLIDSSGSTYSSTTGGCEPRLGAAPLLRSQAARGWIDFRVPRARSGFTLVYSPRIGASTKTTDVQVRLGR